MKNSIEKFEQKNMSAFETLALINNQKKQMETQEKQIKEMLLEAMEKSNITSIDNDIVRINLIPKSETVSLDTKAFLQAEPELYHDIESKYSKRVKKKSYIRIAVK